MSKQANILYKKRKNSYLFGIFAEYIAIIFLILRGYKILKKRYKNYYGEIDLIALKRNLLIIIEVKARRNLQKDNHDIESLISNKQKNRIKKSSSFFISKNAKYKDLGVRFDLIIVEKFRLPFHIKDYW